MELFSVIAKYQYICIYRHVNPDFDAYGSQLGLAYMIKQHFPHIKVMLKGKKNEELLNKLEEDYIIDVFDEVKEALAIVLDTANHERIDGDDYSLCKEIIKVDHHIVVDSFGDINIEMPKKSSTCQIVTELYKNAYNEFMNEKSARYLYFGMIADSNRFMYRQTDASTLMCAAYLLECGINIEKIYQRMYVRKEVDLKVNRYILNKYQSTGTGIAYYILKQEDLDELGISREKGSDYVNMLSNIEEFKIWMAVTQNTELNNWRVSIRSREVSINSVAEKFHGGGHQLASGATLSSLDELPALILALEERL